ncbi:EbsA family protein [Lapidilactobacillus bayanensis]|uniref:EbsA family protein n=1 Tax=Lapidilactobacillus bayanensis TaxID=2485998 RepID=UPI000F7968C2|nr:EbsA family protein [Lapidilactobacillus bayanensis]
MSKNKKFYCQPLTLNRLNLWLWVTCLLLLGIILQLEQTDTINWLSLVLAGAFVVLAVHLVLSSFITVSAGKMQLHFPFSRQALVLSKQQVAQLTTTPHTIEIELSHHKFSYRYLMTAKRQTALLKLWKEQS